MDSSRAKDTRRADILNKASELLALQPAATLVEIADYAGIGKATLHRYFASREDLILALGYRALDLVARAIESAAPEQGSALDALRRVIDALVPLGDKLHFLLSEPVLDTHPDFNAADQATEAPILRLIQQAQIEGDLRADLSAEWILYVMNYALFAAWQSVHDGAVARRDAPRLLATTLFDGFRAR